MKIHLYNNTGSKNRGCEAIIQSTLDLIEECKLVHDSTFLSTHDIQEDCLLGLDKRCHLIGGGKFSKYNPIRYLGGFLRKYLGLYQITEYNRNRNFYNQLSENDLILSIGGDTYCYPSRPYNYYAMNNYAKRHGVKTIFWNCSIEPALVEKIMIRDFQNYSFIFARESLTYAFLQSINYPQERLFLSADSAFILKPTPNHIIEESLLENAIGINCSNAFLSGVRNEAISDIIDWIIINTDKHIYLVCHVYNDKTGDNVFAKQTYDQYAKTGRVHTIPGQPNCREIKYIISKFDMFISCRTHATIAGYSSLVPTLALGYSIKSRGIAKDLFGDDKRYVVDFAHLSDKNELVNGFHFIYENKEKIRAHLNNIIPEYQQRVINAIEVIKKIDE